MTALAPHLTAYLRERLPVQKGASEHTCEIATAGLLFGGIGALIAAVFGLHGGFWMGAKVGAVLGGIVGVILSLIIGLLPDGRLTFGRFDDNAWPEDLPED